MTSALAVDFLVLLGAAAQCTLVLRARRFAAADRNTALGLLCGLPVAFLGFMGVIRRADSTVGLGFIGLGLGGIGAGYYMMMKAPARVTAAGLVSLTATFWVAFYPGAPFPGWFIPAASMSVYSVIYAFGPWEQPPVARLLLYLWFLLAAAAIAASGLSSEAVYALILRAGDSVNPLSIGEAALTGAQGFLLVQFVIGLFLMLADDEQRRREKFANRVVASFDPGGRLGWRAAVMILAQAAVLAYARREGAAAQSELLSLAALAALAHGAMTGDDADGAEPRPEPAPVERKFLNKLRKRRRPLIGAAIAVLACGVAAAARAAGSDEDDVLAAIKAVSAPAPAAAAAASAPPPRPERAAVTDTNSDPSKVFHAKGGPDKAVARGGAVIIDAAGGRLEIAPAKRAAPETLRLAAPALPALPSLDDPKAGLAERKSRATALLAGSALAAFALALWARRWRSGA